MAIDDNKDTTIQIKVKTRRNLARIGTVAKFRSYDDIITEFVKCAEKLNKVGEREESFEDIVDKCIDAYKKIHNIDE
jgi:uncharacterized protein YaaR (DUF327 family)